MNIKQKILALPNPHLAPTAVKDYNSIDAFYEAQEQCAEVAQKEMDALIAEVKAIVKCAETATDGDTGDTIYIGEAYPEDDINAILDKWSTK